MAEQAEAVEPKKVAAGKLAKHASAVAQRRAGANWQRSEYARSRGHRTYQGQAQRCERFYLGAGLQWDAADKMVLAETGRKPVEDNQIMQMVNTAIGYQIANRMDIAVRARGFGADDASAKNMGKVIKYVADDTKLHWRETEVFGDGMIMQRGYFDVRMGFDRNALGEIETTSLDPLDVMPDPDARAYDPEEWADVTIDRWYTLNQIEQIFGRAARQAVENFESADMGILQDSSDGAIRPRFGGEGFGDMAYISELNDNSTVLYHIIDRQYRTYEMVKCAIYATGDIRQIPNATPQQVAAYQANGAMITNRMQRRVKWMVSTRNISLFDDYSPYPWFTIVPFFPYFRRGQTRGMVDNAISPQECLNKGLSQLGHILNTAANSGYYIEQNSLVDMTVAEFRNQAAKNGLVIEYKEKSQKPEKIMPSPVPSGIVEYIAQSRASLVSSTGIDEALSSSGPMNEMSGVAYQARQYAAQQKLAIPLDNLARTRHMVAQRYIDLIQMFMDAPRILRIVGQDEFGDETTEELSVNQPVLGEGGQTEWLNDLTVGEYDLVISEQPMQITFDNSQFEQIKSLAKDMGYVVPPSYALRYTALSDKAEIAKAITEASAAKPDPLQEAEVALKNAQANLAAVTAVNKSIEAVYGATQAGAQIATIPQVASIADEVLQSAGFVDQNPAPIIPQGQIGAGLTDLAPAAPTIEAPIDDPNGPAPTNTDPTAPSNPGVGLTAGIEAPGAQV